MDEDRFDQLDKKRFRQERKQAKDKDRSKYKKTDRSKFEEGIQKEFASKSSRETLLKGRVISIVPEGILVFTEGKTYSCQLRGLLKKHKTEAKNLITVGDIVLFEPQGESGWITFIEPRRSSLSRSETLSHKKMQLIAANIDQVLITVSVGNPVLRPSIVERYVIATKIGKMEPLIVINKIDLLTPEEEPLLKELLAAYEKASIPTLLISAKTGQGMEELKQAMKDKTSVFSGQSGVGKSSLINEVAGFSLKIGDVVQHSWKGSHTTTTTSLLPLPFGGFVIDTPGIKSFGVWSLKVDELLSYYPEFNGMPCKFPNCTHTHEPDCALIAAIEEGSFPPLRYHSYLTLLEDLNKEHFRR